MPSSTSEKLGFADAVPVAGHDHPVLQAVARHPIEELADAARVGRLVGPDRAVEQVHVASEPPQRLRVLHVGPEVARSLQELQQPHRREQDARHRRRHLAERHQADRPLAQQGGEVRVAERLELGLPLAVYEDTRSPST